MDSNTWNHNKTRKPKQSYQHAHTLTVLLIITWPWPLTFWPQGQCLPRDCRALYVYQVWCLYSTNLLPTKVRLSWRNTALNQFPVIEYRIERTQLRVTAVSAQAAQFWDIKFQSQYMPKVISGTSRYLSSMPMADSTCNVWLPISVLYWPQAVWNCCHIISH